MTDSTYQWLVRRGRIGLALDADAAEVELQVDPEGSNFCVLTPQDAGEVAQILTQFARSLWERFQHQPELHGTAGAHEIDASSAAMTWQTEAGPLEVEINAGQDLIRFGGAQPMTLRLRIRPLTELIQWLAILVRRAEAQ